MQLRLAPTHIAAEPTLVGAGVWLVIPCYRVREHLPRVIAKAPDWVEGIVCVDDACPENSVGAVAEGADPRVVIVRLAENQGVGGATLAGYAEAVRRGGRIIVKVDGDDQMDLGHAARLVAPILLGEADYAKGNRFTSVSHLSSMPTVRVFGNAALSFAAKVSTGYWNIFDPTNGFIAMDARLFALLPVEKIQPRYFFESDLLFRIGTLRAVVLDIPMQARYRDEVSNLRVHQALLPFLLGHLRNAGKRIFYNYFLRDFSIASVNLLVGSLLLAGGTALGGYKWWSLSRAGILASSGTVMLAALPVIIGFQLLISALTYDIQNVPREPVSKYLRRPPPPAA